MLAIARSKNAALAFARLGVSSTLTPVAEALTCSADQVLATCSATSATARPARLAVGVTLGVVVVPETFVCEFSAGALTVKPPVGYSAMAITHDALLAAAAVTAVASDAPATFQNSRMARAAVEA